MVGDWFTGAGGVRGESLLLLQAATTSVVAASNERCFHDSCYFI